jgi:hypothetical protein
MSASDILRLGAGSINAINDVAIGVTGTPYGPPKNSFGGQLGKILTLDNDDIVFDPSIGTVYGGDFQYVQLAPTAAKPVVGQTLFWVPASPTGFIVTSDQSLSTPAATLIAGVNLNNNWTPGNYGVIQIAGLIFLKFRATLTVAGAVGSPVYVATAGGADLGFADVLTADATAAANANFLGRAADAPTNGGLKRVWVRTK